VDNTFQFILTLFFPCILLGIAKEIFASMLKYQLKNQTKLFGKA